MSVLRSQVSFTYTHGFFSDLKDMPEIYDRRLSACNKLESAETSLIGLATKLHNKKLKEAAKAAKKSGKPVDQSSGNGSDDRPLTEPSIGDAEQDITLAEKLVPKEKRPTHRLPAGFMPFALPFIGKKVDTIEWAREEIDKTTKELEERRKVLAQDIAKTSEAPPAETAHPDDDVAEPEEDKEHPSQTYPPLNSAFVLFNKQIAAHLALQSLTHHQPYRMTGKFVNVSPDDIIWSNLNMNPYEARVRKAISWAITAALIIFWAIPVAFVGFVSNIHALCAQYSWLNWICNLPKVVVGIISGILPPVLLAVLMMLLPIVLRLLSKFEGVPQRTGVELSLMTRFFLFQVVVCLLQLSLFNLIATYLTTCIWAAFLPHRDFQFGHHRCSPRSSERSHIYPHYPCSELATGFHLLPHVSSTGIPRDER